MDGVGLTNRSTVSSILHALVNAIWGISRAELTFSATGGTLAADGTQQSLYVDVAPLGCSLPHVVKIDLDDMQAGDTVVVRVFHRLVDGGAMQQEHYATYTGADGGLLNSNVVAIIDLTPNRHGMRVTLQQTAGTNRSYPWEVFVEI